jgi:hypothetical protein
MPRRNPDTSFSLAEAASMPDTTPTLSRPRPKRSGFYVPIDQVTGQIDMARARPEQIEQLRTTLTAPKAIEPEKPPVNLDPKLIEQGYSLLEVIIQRGGKFLLKWPNDLAVEMRFAEDKKARLVETSKPLADKYCPVWLVENQELAAFGAALADAVNDMVMNATRRYGQKVINGECPPPPGFKFPEGVRAKPPVTVSPPPTPPAASQPPSATPPVNNKPPVVSVSGTPFVPTAGVTQ